MTEADIAVLRRKLPAAHQDFRLTLENLLSRRCVLTLEEIKTYTGDFQRGVPRSIVQILRVWSTDPAPQAPDCDPVHFGDPHFYDLIRARQAACRMHVGQAGDDLLPSFVADLAAYFEGRVDTAEVYMRHILAIRAIRIPSPSTSNPAPAPCPPNSTPA